MSTFSQELAWPNVKMVAQTGVNIDYLVLRAGAGNSVQGGAGTSNCGGTCGSLSDKWNSLSRVVMNFDTSSIPAGAVLTSGVLSIYWTSYGWQPTYSPTPYWAIFDIYGNDPTNIVATDFGQCNITKLSSSDTEPPSNPCLFPLNADGLNYINKGGYTSICLREENYDVDFVAPPWKRGSLGGGYYFNVDWDGVHHWVPKLTVEYTLSTFKPRVMWF